MQVQHGVVLWEGVRGAGIWYSAGPLFKGTKRTKLPLVPASIVVPLLLARNAPRQPKITYYYYYWAGCPEH